MKNLPEDVLLDIFIRLQAKQVAQMRCLSQSWNHLLSQPSFVKSHLHRSIHNNDGILLIFFDFFSFDSEPFTAHLSRSPYLELPNFIKLPVNLQSKKGGGGVIGSVHGLICFEYRSHQDSKSIYIWNPSLSALLTLPPYSIPSHSYDLINQKFRFGFDPKADDYKVVKLIQVDNEWMPVEVYSMRKGSWKLITQQIPSHVTSVYGRDDICVDGQAGYVHWLAETYSGLKFVNTILSFDLGEETFREIPFPESVTRPVVDGRVSRKGVDLGVLDGKLCVISSVLDHKCEVWVMEEYGVAESWVKHHVIPPFIGDLDPFGFTLHNEFLVRVYGHGLALYDPVASKTKWFKFRMEYYCKGGKVVDYVDSLVWVTPNERHEMSCCNNSMTSTSKSFLHSFWGFLIDDCRFWVLMMMLSVGLFWILVK